MRFSDELPPELITNLAEDYPNAVMIPAFFSDTARARRDAVRGVHIAYPLYRTGLSLDTPTVWTDTDSPYSKALEIIGQEEGSGDLPPKSMIVAAEAIMAETFELTFWAKYLPRQTD